MHTGAWDYSNIYRLGIQIHVWNLKRYACFRIQDKQLRAEFLRAALRRSRGKYCTVLHMKIEAKSNDVTRDYLKTHNKSIWNLINTITQHQENNRMPNSMKNKSKCSERQLVWRCQLNTTKHPRRDKNPYPILSVVHAVIFKSNVMSLPVEWGLEGTSFYNSSEGINQP